VSVTIAASIERAYREGPLPWLLALERAGALAPGKRLCARDAKRVARLVADTAAACAEALVAYLTTAERPQRHAWIEELARRLLDDLRAKEASCTASGTLARPRSSTSTSAPGRSA